jgi:hypothetical protein
LGGTGAWDHAFIWNFIPVSIVSGTWYALYSAGSSTTTYQFSTGLATSSDGVTWTKYGSNPVLANGYVGAVVSVGGNYYAWFGLAQPGQNQTLPALDPTQTIRYQSLDLKTWKNPTHSIHTSQLFEGMNATTGQSYPNSLVDIGRKAYMFTTSSSSDSAVPSVYNLGLAIAPAPIELIVLYPEDAAQQIATDSFSGGAGNLSAKWTTPTGGTKLQISASSTSEPSAINTHCGQFYSGATFSPNQYSEITIGSLSSGGYMYPTVRGQTGAVSWYESPIPGPAGTLTTTGIYKMVSGTETQIGPTISFTPQVGDTMRLMATTGSDGYPVLTLFQNGFQLLQVDDYGNTFTSGYPGISQYGSTVSYSQVSSFAAGNAGVIPTYSSTFFIFGR